MSVRHKSEFKFTFPAGVVTSQAIDVGAGCMGTLIVPSGSGLIGKTLNVQAVSKSGLFADVDLMAIRKTLVAGANRFSADELLEIGAASVVKLSINSSVPGVDSDCVLLWGS